MYNFDDLMCYLFVLICSNGNFFYGLIEEEAEYLDTLYSNYGNDYRDDSLDHYFFDDVIH